MAIQKEDYTRVIYDKGCLRAGEEWVERNLVPVAGVAVAISVLQVLVPRVSDPSLSFCLPLFCSLKHFWISASRPRKAFVFAWQDICLAAVSDSAKSGNHISCCFVLI